MKTSKSGIMIGILCGLLTGCNSTHAPTESNELFSVNSENLVFSESNSYTNSESLTESSEENEMENQYISFKENIKLYINPSVQYTNPYASNLGNEGQRMNEISLLLTQRIKEYTNIEVYANNALPGLSLSNSVKESNQLKVNYHLALHSNAGGGIGSEGWYTQTSYSFAKSIIDFLQDVLPYPTRGLKNGKKTLYELKSTYASACLIEILFHDDVKQAQFLVTQQEKIASAIYQGIIAYFIEKYNGEK